MYVYALNMSTACKGDSSYNIATIINISFNLLMCLISQVYFF